MTSSSNALAGRRILVVEDEFLTADEIVRTLRGSGAEILAAVPTVREALALIRSAPSIDAAIIDVKLAGEFSYPVAEALNARDTPFVFSTIFRRDELPERFRRTPHCAKPVQPPILLALLQEALERHRPAELSDDALDAAGEGAGLSLPVSRFPLSDLSEWIQVIAQHRDRGAFGELFLAVAPKVKGFMLRFGLPDHIAEDLAQDVMLTIWRRTELYDPARGSAIAWIFTIARDARLDMIRREHPESPRIGASGAAPITRAKRRRRRVR